MINRDYLRGEIIRHKKSATIAAAFFFVLCVAVMSYVLLPEPESVSGLTIKEAGFDSASLKWEESKSASEYEIYRSENGKDYDLIAETEKPFFKDKKLTTGKTYRYKVKAKNLIKSSAEAKIKVTPKLDKPEMNGTVEKGKVALIIEPVEGADSYSVYRNGKKLETFKAEDVTTSGKKTKKSKKTVKSLDNKSEEKSDKKSDKKADKPASAKVENESDTVSVMEYVDETAKEDEDYTYSVKANRGSSTSEESEDVNLALVSAGDLSARIIGEDILVSWDKSETYTSYKLYLGDELLTETEECECIIENAAEGDYSFKLVGFNEDAQSPETTKDFTVEVGELNREEVIEAALYWGRVIGDDNSFHYGRKSKGAQNLGCYFCGTNQPGSSRKAKAGMGYAEREKTWACCEFVTACFVHGGGVNDMSCMHNWIGTGANSNKYLKRSNNWTKLGHIAYGNLEPGDVIMTKGHTVIYSGNGYCIESHGGDDGKRGSKRWNWSIGEHNYSKGRYGSATVWRYTGNGAGATGLRIVEKDDKADQTEEAEKVEE